MKACSTIALGMMLLACQLSETRSVPVNSKGHAGEKGASNKLHRRGQSIAVSKTPEAARVTKRVNATKPAKARKGESTQRSDTMAIQRAPKPNKPVAKWPTAVKWMSWLDGRRAAAASGRPLMLVVYADWCPRCRELTPIFGRANISALAKKFVMVKQDQDQRPAWLADYNEQGTYVPRIFFFGPDGQLRTDVTSGHSRYPYFYTPQNVDALQRSMTRASEG